jgi:murein DD-endopeptidase MepM/ murein hydrolase activator NlpD
MSVSDEFPLAEENLPPSGTGDAAVEETASSSSTNQVGQIGARLSDLGLTEPFARYGKHLLIFVAIVAVAGLMRLFFLNAQEPTLEIRPRSAFAAEPEQAATEAAVESEATQSAVDLALPEFWMPPPFATGIPRFALIYTTIPQRPRVEIISYEVVSGDTVFGIAEKYGLKPETVLWGNQDVLNDDPHALKVGQILRILPIDGTFHAWSAGESFTRVADFYGVLADTIIEYPGNFLDVFTFSLDQPELEPGTALIIPGGTREYINWGPPLITRSDPASARTYGPGFCGEVYTGAVGTGFFVWPTVARHLSGYDFSPATNHNGIDLAGPLGNSVFASDTGVVVFAGWSNFGYGNLVVLDHGNGWQTLYAHLDSYHVFCGQSIFQSAALGSVGTTGNSSGPHLHYEMIYNGAKVNPWNFISP